VNPLSAAFRCERNPTFRELQLQVRNVSWKVWSMESVPFSQVVKTAQQRNDPSRHPLFQIIFSHAARLQHVRLAGADNGRSLDGGSTLDLTVVIDDRGDAGLRADHLQPGSI